MAVVKMYRKTLILCVNGDYLNVPKILENAKHMSKGK
jgi:hypothetical protein